MSSRETRPLSVDSPAIPDLPPMSPHALSRILNPATAESDQLRKRPRLPSIAELESHNRADHIWTRTSSISLVGSSRSTDLPNPLSLAQYSLSPTREYNYDFVAQADADAQASFAQEEEDQTIRDDRVEYDAEEVYALCFLRLQSDLSAHRWQDLIERQWRYIFPAGQPRRLPVSLQTGKVVSQIYPQRSGCALQSKYYRVRRKLGFGSSTGRRADAFAMDQAALRGLESALTEFWFSMLTAEQIVRWNLERAPQEREVDHMQKLKAVYHQQGAFWGLLANVSFSGD